MQIKNYLYTLRECGGCEKARHYLINEGIEFEEILIDNPLTELGVRGLLNGNLIAPIIAIAEKGFYMLAEDNRLIKIKYPR